MQSDDWPADHSQALCEFFAKGLSYSAIANAINAKFGTAYTRNAALGRAKRMALDAAIWPDRASLPIRESRVPREIRDPVEISPRKIRERRVSEFWRLPPVFKATETDRLRTADVVPHNLSLLDLKKGDCRYPYGGDTGGQAITFCGHPKRPGSSYCAAHFDLIVGPGTASERAAVRDLLKAVEAVEPRVPSVAWPIFFHPAV